MWHFKSVRKSQLSPFVVKSAGGAASQCLTLMSAIYVSNRINRPFVIQHYPYSTGGYFPIAIQGLLATHELDPNIGRTRGLTVLEPLPVGKIIEAHPLLKKGLSYEKILNFVRFLHLEKPIKRLRGEWYLDYSRQRLENVPNSIRKLSGGYFPFIDAEIRKEMDLRFKSARLPSPFDPASIEEPKPDVVIHYRIGEKRTTYSHAALRGDGIVDPISFRQILEKEILLDSKEIYVVSDEPGEAQALLLSVGIKAKTNPIRGDLWLDLCLMSRADLLICPWSTVSQLAATFMVEDGKKVYYPEITSTGFIPKWRIDGLKIYKPSFLPPHHSIYKSEFQLDEGAHRIYDGPN